MVNRASRPPLSGALLVCLAACAGPALDPSAVPPTSAGPEVASAAPSSPAPAVTLLVAAGAPPEGGATVAAPMPADPKLEACRAALAAGKPEGGGSLANLSPVASTRALLRIFAKRCHDRFPAWADAAERASHVGRVERSRILGHTVADTCPSAETAGWAREVLDACHPVGFLEGASSVLWRRLDAGTYAFLRALASTGLQSFVLEELLLQASLTPELDR